MAPFFKRTSDENTGWAWGVHGSAVALVDENQ